MFSPHLEEREALSKKKGYPSYLSKEGLPLSLGETPLVQSLDALEYELDKVVDTPFIVGIHVEILPPGNNATYRHSLMP